MPEQGVLKLASGESFSGQHFGALCETQAEVVFSTSLSGFTEALSDPAYRGQILVLASPLQGNYPVESGQLQSRRIQVAGLLVQRYCPPPPEPNQLLLAAWLQREGIPALSGVQTRALIHLLRQRSGPQQARLCLSDPTHLASAADVQAAPDSRWAIQTDKVSPQHNPRPQAEPLKILLLDCGAKTALLEALEGIHPLQWLPVPLQPPHGWPAAAHWAEADGLLISSGPGDPRAMPELVALLQAALPHFRQRPVLGICLGAQLLALAAGARIEALPGGRRSVSLAARCLSQPGQPSWIVSQNHGYGVQAESLPPEWQPWFVYLQDQRCAGLRHRVWPWAGVQFHPEGAPGPSDTAWILQDFMAAAARARQQRLKGPAYEL